MSDLLYEVKDKIATITLNRPDKLNAFTRDMIDAWAKSLSAAQADDSVNVIVVTGSGRAFCSGGDVGRMREGEPTALDGKNSLWEGVHRVPKTLETVDKPVIAMVNGLAVGAGMGMCVMCDMRVAAESARFGCLERRFGVPLIDGGTQRLPRVVGLGRALDLVLSGRLIDAHEAERIGLVNRVVPDGSALEYAVELAQEIASYPWACVLADRTSMYEGLGRPLEEGIELEARRGRAVLIEARIGAARFAAGAGRGGRFH